MICIWATHHPSTCEYDLSKASLAQTNEHDTANILYDLQLNTIELAFQI